MNQDSPLYVTQSRPGQHLVLPAMQSCPLLLRGGDGQATLGPESSASTNRQGPHLPFRRLNWHSPWMPVLFVGSWHRMRLLWPFFLAWMAGQMLVAASHPPLLPCHTHRSSSLQAFFFIGVHSTSRSGPGCSCARTLPARQRAASKPRMRKATTLNMPCPPPPAALLTRRNPASQPASAEGLHSGRKTSPKPTSSQRRASAATAQR